MTDPPRHDETVETYECDPTCLMNTMTAP